MPPRDDGLLIAYKMEKYRLINKFEIEFYLNNHDLLDKQNVALLCLLENKETKMMYLIVNCHILFNKNRGDIKYTQINLIMRSIDLLLDQYSMFGLIKMIRTYSLYGEEISTQLLALLCTTS